MNIKEFRKHAHEAADWMADYLDHIEQYPVKSEVTPGDIIKKLPETPPQKGESMKSIMEDFKHIILPGMTHWQHPGFFAYFNANNSYPSILAEMLTATMGAQCMSWVTSPAATELEERVMQWTAKMIGLPTTFSGVIQDTASSATLCSLLTAREKQSDYRINDQGLYGMKKFTVYCSQEAHSSIEKDVKIAGLGKDNLRKIEVDKDFAMIPRALEEKIQSDLKNNRVPLAVVAAVGTTGSTAIDPLKDITEICLRHNLWLHVDAAYAGTALLLPETRWMIRGIEMADSFVFNPHKWMFTNFDCSAYYVKNKEALIRTFEILPEYLKTKEGQQVNNYRDWGIQLGRRFRALKLWFVIRNFGVKGLQQKIRDHIQWAQELKKEIEDADDFEMLAPTPLATLCFRYKPKGIDDTTTLNKLNADLLDRLNQSNQIYITHTKLDGKYSLRLVIGQTNLTRKHVSDAWKLICKTSKKYGD
ncbi:MAG: aspartate aminotransferase family protein [Candidatus Aminicenantes bacterium]|nr:aspartate aminotransferase family protein [Candidatus Aminicenantes bacterium]